MVICHMCDDTWVGGMFLGQILGVTTCDILLCLLPIVSFCFIVLIVSGLLLPLQYYYIRTFHMLLHRGWAIFPHLWKNPTILQFTEPMIQAVWTFIIHGERINI